METLTRVINKILKTKDIEAAEKLINSYGRSKNNFDLSDLLSKPEVCNHLGWLFHRLESPVASGNNRQEDIKNEIEYQNKYYETGKRLYIQMVQVNGKGSLIITPFLAIWFAKFLSSRVFCQNPQDEKYISDDEIIRLSQIVDGGTREAIDKCYCDRIRKIWVNKPKE